MKKTPENIIILHLYTTNDDHMIHGSWDMVHQTEFFVISTIFSCSSPGKPGKSTFWKIKKMPVDIIILHMCRNENHMMYVS